MKTKWMIIPVVALILGCSREIDTNVTYIDGEFRLYATSGESDQNCLATRWKSVLESLGLYHGVLWERPRYVHIDQHRTCGFRRVHRIPRLICHRWRDGIQSHLSSFQRHRHAH